MPDLTREDVIEHVRNRVSLEFADLRGMDLRGLDLQKVNFRGAELGEAKLQGSRLSDTNLVRAKLMEADLTGCNLSDADLSGADLTKAALYEANLANTKMVNTVLRGADLTQADCTNADMGHADLQRAKCITTDFRNAILADADFSNALLRGALFRGANLMGANFQDAVGLDPAILHGQAGPPEKVILPRREASKPLDIALIGAHQASPYAAGHLLQPAAPQPKGTKYHPPLRHVPAVIFTTGGWIRGIFHIPVMHGFLEHLNLVGDMLKLTRVTLPYLNLELRFFGLRRNKALLVLPDCDPKGLNLPEPTADFHVHRVSFLLEGGTVTGSLAIEEDIRVSDYLANHNQFVVLRNCRFGAHGTGKDEQTHFPLLLVNCASVVGASDEQM